MLSPTSDQNPLFREFLEASPDATIIFDLSGRILLGNSRADELFGYAPATLEGQLSQVLMPERFRARHEEHLARFFQHPAKRPMGAGMELFGLRRNGEEFPVDISLSPLRTSDGLRAISAIRDVSDRKKAEEKLVEANRHLQSALDLVKRLTGILPICGFCKKIRDPDGAWKPVENYIRDHSEAEFSHGFCPECGRKHYGALIEP